MIDAGAAIVLGHHPHVIQGMELHRDRPIAYSLGNFVACEVPFSDGDRVTWNRRGRTGCLLLAELTRGHVGGVRQVATFDDGSRVRVDDSAYGRRIIAKTNRALEHGVTSRRFRRHALWVEAIRPALGYLRWSKLRTLRLGKLRKAFASARKARNSH
jgi:poly-gamma-glutamate synthesis protein (capsule biosynthesis protein)